MSPEPVDGERSLPLDATPCVCWPTPSRGVADALHLVLDVAPDTARAVRAAVREWSAVADLGPDTVDAIVLAVDEAVTNVVDHAHGATGGARTASAARGRVEVTVSGQPCGNGVAVAVVDDGSWRPPPADPGYRGRGIQVIGGLAGRSTIEPAEDGTTVRMCWETPVGGAARAGHE